MAAPMLRVGDSVIVKRQVWDHAVAEQDVRLTRLLPQGGRIPVWLRSGTIGRIEGESTAVVRSDPMGDPVTYEVAWDLDDLIYVARVPDPERLSRIPRDEPRVRAVPPWGSKASYASMRRLRWQARAAPPKIQKPAAAPDGVLDLTGLWLPERVPLNARIVVNEIAGYEKDYGRRPVAILVTPEQRTSLWADVDGRGDPDAASLLVVDGVEIVCES